MNLETLEYNGRSYQGPKLGPKLSIRTDKAFLVGFVHLFEKYFQNFHDFKKLYLFEHYIDENLRDNYRIKIREYLSLKSSRSETRFEEFNKK